MSLFSRPILFLFFLFSLSFLSLPLPLIQSRPISDCCCDESFLQTTSINSLQSILDNLKRTVFFRTFKVNLHTTCPFWADHSQCAKRGCEVCGECGWDELPIPWRDEASAPADFSGLGRNFQQWNDQEDQMWVVQDSSNTNSPVSYINMQMNPESYTGYTGFSPHRIWSAIYEENCFQGPMESLCYEERVMYRLISGMHASISAHIAYHYPIHAEDPDPSDNPSFNLNGDDEDVSLLAPNVHVYDYKLGNYPDRLENLKFAFVFMLRAMNKATPILLNSNYYDTGNIKEDTELKSNLNRLLTSGIIASCEPDHSFDERKMFNSIESAPLKHQFRAHFRNISRIMDCVGCTKCRLHGKLIVSGLGTALKILFSDNIQRVTLQRTEVMALVATLAKFSHALQMVEHMESMKTRQSILKRAIVGLITGILAVSIALTIRMIAKKKAKKGKKVAMASANSSSNSNSVESESKSHSVAAAVSTVSVS